MNTPLKTNHIDRTIQKTWQYWYVDGLVEIAAGAIALIMVVYGALVALAGRGPAAGLALGIGQPLLFLGSMLLARRTILAYKERLTFPRTGYVSYPHPKRERRIFTMVLGAVISAGLVITLAVLTPRLDRAFLPVISAAAMALFIIYMGVRLDLKRFYLIGGLLLVTGAVSAGLRLPEEIGMDMVLIVLGLGLIVSGTLTLRRYLNTTTPVEG